MLLPTLLLLLAGPTAPQRDAVVRAVLVHVRDASTSFDTEAKAPPPRWFDTPYDTVLVGCGVPPGVSSSTSSPCSLPADLLRESSGRRTLLAVSTAPPRKPATHPRAFAFYVSDITLQGVTATVSVHFRYATYSCSGYYSLAFSNGAWRVLKATVNVIS